MPILTSEVKRYKAAVNSDAAGNGGRMTNTEIVSAVRQALFPNVTQAERDAGITRYRKHFIKIDNDDDLILSESMVHLLGITPADDYVEFCVGTFIDTQGDLSSPRFYGAGVLASAVLAEATEITLTLENSAMEIFNEVTNDNYIFIKDGTNIEYFSAVTAVKSGTGVTLTLDGTDALVNGYETADTIVGSCYYKGDIETVLSSFDDSDTTSGTYNEGTHPITLDNLGTIYDSWTLTFSSATEFSVSGASTGAVGSGNITTNFAPTNSYFSKPYFTIPSAAWGGTWANGDTVTFVTSPAAIPIWFKEVVPAGSASYSGNGWTTRLVGETA